MATSRSQSHRLRILAGIFIIAAAGYGLAALAARPAAEHPWFASRAGQHRPLVFAHQGGENIRPSNTMEAFRHAASLGADVLDADMHMTRDGVLVLMHDQTVDRTTDGTGAIRDMSWEDVRRLDAGYRFTTDGGGSYPYRGQGLRVPQVGELFEAFPDKRFGIEIKQTTVDAAAAFCAVIREHGMEDRVLVSSFAQENMDAFRAACPAVATSATRGEVLRFFILSVLRLHPTFTPNYQSLQVPEYNSGIHLLTSRFVRAAHSRGLAVQPWTINEEVDLRRMIALDVDGINTDNPDGLLEILR